MRRGQFIDAKCNPGAKNSFTVQETLAFKDS